MAETQPHAAPRADRSGGTLIEPRGWDPPALRGATVALRFAERVMFAVVGLLLAAAALTLACRSLVLVYELIVTPSSQTIDLTAHFLDIILLILMLAEIIYTVTISLRGAVLSAQPFLIVGLIAIIRRILVLTVQDVRNGDRVRSGLVSATTIDLAVLTAVVLVFVFAIYLLQRRANVLPPRETQQ